MLTFLPMTKSEAIDIFGGAKKDLAEGVGVTASAISQWPDELDQARIDQVIGAAVRLRKHVPARFLLRFPAAGTKSA